MGKQARDLRTPSSARFRKQAVKRACTSHHTANCSITAPYPLNHANAMQPDIARISRKRQWEDSTVLDKRESPINKKRKRIDDRPRRRPEPSFYDTLSKVHLTQAALEEFDRRVRLTQLGTELRIAKPSARTPRPRRSLGSTQHARRSGADLSFLRGASFAIHLISQRWPC